MKYYRKLRPCSEVGRKVKSLYPFRTAIGSFPSKVLEGSWKRRRKEVVLNL